LGDRKSFASGQCAENTFFTLDGLRQEKFNLNLPTDWESISP